MVPAGEVLKGLNFQFAFLTRGVLPSKGYWECAAGWGRIFTTGVFKAALENIHVHFEIINIVFIYKTQIQQLLFKCAIYMLITNAAILKLIK